MVLNREETNSLIRVEPQNYMVLDTEHIRGCDKQKRFELAIELLNICNTLNWGNTIFAKTDPKQQIKFDILYQAMDAVLKDGPFTNAQLIEYFSVKQEIENFAGLMVDFTDLDEKTWFPEIDLLLLGLTLEDQDEYENKSLMGDLHNEYADVYDELFKNTSDIQHSIDAAKSIVKETKEKHSNPAVEA